MTGIKQPTDRRPSLAKKHTNKTKAETDKSLDQGFAFTDIDGERIIVRFGDVRASHEARLRAATSMGFINLMQAMETTQSLDLLASCVWFGRLVNGREPGDYFEFLDEFGYADVEALGFGEPSEDENPPEASGASS